MKNNNYIEVATKIYNDKYPTAKALFLAGSVVRGDDSKYSDLDLVILFDQLECASRESYIYEGWPVEAFLHTKETLNYFFTEVNRPCGEPSLSQMISESIVIPKASHFSDSIKQWAGNNQALGPLKVSEKEIKSLQYSITDLIDDIREPKNNQELMATGAELYNQLATFYFRTQNKWRGEKKYIPRLLKKYNSELATKYDLAFKELFTNNKTDKLINLAEEILSPYGGFYFNGYQSDAPKTWSLKELAPVTINTERLTLRHFIPDDAENVYNILKDGAVSKTTLNIPIPYKLKDAKWWINHHRHQNCLGNQFTFAITNKVNKELIGCISVIFNKTHETGELGYWIGEKFWGKGFCSEAARSVLKYSFEEVKINKIKARYTLVNPASGKVMENIGMKKEGTLIEDVKRPDGQMHDMGLYGLTRKQYFEGL